MKKRTAFDERMARRWNVSHRTILNWRIAAEKEGLPCPMDTDNPDDFLEWYRATMGREPSSKLKEAGRRIMRETGEGVELLTEVSIDRAPFELLEAGLERIGKGRTLARVLEEEEVAAAIYQEARKEGRANSTLRKNWSEAAAMANAARKQDDAVELALELLKECVRREMEPAEQERRRNLSGKAMARAGVREKLMECRNEEEWIRVWNAAIGEGLEG